MKPTVGYLLNKSGGLEGMPGLFYDYILASNGLLVRAEKLASTGVPVLRATVPVAEAQVRGLAALEPRLDLPQGKVPGGLWHAALRMAQLCWPRELYLAITWQGLYCLKVPEQEATSCSIRYTALPDTVVDIHSHGQMGAHFSATDNADDQGLRISIVVGHVERLEQEVSARVSVYGYTGPVWLGDIFML